MSDPRNATESRLMLIEQTAWGTAPVAGEAFVWPLGGAADVGSDRNRVEIPLFRGSYEPHPSALGITSMGGNIPTVGEFLFWGRLAKAFLGTVRPDGGSNYTRADKRHRWGSNGRPKLYALEAQFQESPADYIFSWDHLTNSWDFTAGQEGGVTFTVNDMGSGRETSSGTAHDATPTEDAFQAMNLLDGRIVKGSTELAEVRDFAQTITKNLQRVPAYFNPYAAQITSGKLGATGRLGIAYRDLAYYNEAVSGAPLYMECMYGDRPLEQGFTQWARFMYAGVTFNRGTPRAGGMDPLQINQGWRMEPDSAGFPGEAIATNVETYLIGATTNTLGVKVDGGGTVSKTLTQGAARTAAQIVTDLLGTGGISGATSDRFGGAATTGGRPRVYSNTKGILSSIQIDTAVANSAHTVLGFDNIVRSGQAGSFIFELQNTRASDY